MKPTPKTLLLTATTLLTLTPLAILPSHAAPHQTAPTEKTPHNASGAILSKLEKKLGWPLTLSQREKILSEYETFQTSQNTDKFIQNLSTITSLSTDDLKTTLKKYL
jgi:hypothetical protein